VAHLYQRGKKKIWYAKFYRNGRQVLQSLKTTNFRIARDSIHNLPSKAQYEPLIEMCESVQAKHKVKSLLKKPCTSHNDSSSIEKLQKFHGSER
jgi:hypothetical protein